MSSKNPHKAPLLVLGKLLDETAVPMFVVDADRRIAYCNAALSALLAIPMADIVGRTCSYHAGDADDARQAGIDRLCPPPEVFTGKSATASVLFGLGSRSSTRTVNYFALTDDESSLAGIVAIVGDEAASDRDDRTVRSAAAAHEWLARHRAALPELPNIAALVGTSPAIVQSRDQVELACSSQVSVLLVGPAGTDKRHLARTIGLRSESPLTSLPCQDLSDALLISTLEWADQCTRSSSRRPAVVLENVDLLAAESQIRLADYLAQCQSGPRLLCTSRHELTALARQGLFRGDLACTASTLTIHLAPLVDRLDDLPLLAQHLVEQQNAAGDKQLSGLDHDALEQLLLYNWPGNLDELRQVIAAAHSRSEGPAIGAADLPANFRHVGDARERPPVDQQRIVLDDLLAQIELELIERALAQARGNKTKAAELLGMNRPRFYRRLVQLGLVVEFKPSDDSPPETAD